MVIKPIPQELKTGVHVLMLIARNKDRLPEGYDDQMLKYIVRCEHEWDIHVKELAEQRNTYMPHHRLYACVNQRNVEAAIREFKRRQLNADYEGEELRQQYYLDIENRFISCLMAPSSALSRFMLLDCDTPEQTEKTRSQIPETLLIHEYETRSGHHFITKGFNPNGLTCEVHRDGLMYLG